MTEVKPRDIPSRLKAVGPGVRGAVLYGPDAGMVRDYARQIAGQIVEDLADPFSVVRPSSREVMDNPALLVDEMASISMLGGRRLVWLEGADKSTASALDLALAGDGDGFLLITVGDVRKTDPVVKRMIQAPDMLAIPCYGDEARDIGALIQDALGSAGLTIAGDAMGYLQANLGSDRMVTRQELAKLVTYMGPIGEGAGSTQVTLADVQAVIGDSAAFGLNQIAEAVTGGRKEALESALERAWAGRENAVAILRVVSARMLKFQLARAAVDAGEPAAVVVKKLGVFWKEADVFSSQLTRWSGAKINRALEILLEAESQCKTTGMPGEVICARALLSIAKAA